MRFAPCGNDELLALLDRITHKDASALTALYDNTSPILYGLLLRILHRPEWAHEALQDCYIRVWQHSELYVPEKGEPIAWLIGIARYRALDLLRRMKEGEARLEAKAEDLRDHVRQATNPEDNAVRSKVCKDSAAA